MALLEAAITAGTGIVQAGLQNIYNSAQSAKQFERQKELINLQNQYNSPLAQMKRLAEAGLNPNLVYNSNPSIASAGGNAPPAIPSAGMNSSDIAQTIMASKLNAAQVNNVEADTRLKEAQKNLTETQAQKTGQDYSQSEKTFDYLINNLNLQNKLSEKQILFINSQIDLNNANVSEKKQWVEKTQDIIKLTIKNLEADYVQKKTNSSMAIYNAETGRINASTSARMADSAIQLNEATRREAGVRARKLEEEIVSVTLSNQKSKSAMPYELNQLMQQAMLSAELYKQAKFATSTQEFNFYVKAANESLDAFLKMQQAHSNLMAPLKDILPLIH